MCGLGVLAGVIGSLSGAIAFVRGFARAVGLGSRTCLRCIESVVAATSPQSSLSFAAKAVSTSWASDVVSWFLSARIRCAQIVKASDSVNSLSSEISFSRRAAE